MAAPIVNYIYIIQKNLIEIKFNDLIRVVNSEFTDKDNYAFTPIDGGSNIIIKEVWPDIEEGTMNQALLRDLIQDGKNKVLTKSTFLKVNGGTVGAQYKAVFKDLIGVDTANPMVAADNTFTFKMRSTKVDSVLSRIPPVYNLEIGSVSWAVLAAIGEEDTLIGG